MNSIKYLILAILSIQSIFCDKSALLIIDVQKCFLPNGTLPVPEGEAVIPVINSIRDQFDVVVLTQDWHCEDHVSFASQHSGVEDFQSITLNYDENGTLCHNPEDAQDGEYICAEEDIAHQIDQTMWPDHCVIQSEDAELAEQVGLQIDHDSDIVIQKGFNCEVDSYSAFYDNGGFSMTELHDKLENMGVDTLYITGLALDFCVFYSAMDATSLNYTTYVVEDATRGITPEGIAEAKSQMKENGIRFINSSEVLSSPINGQITLIPCAISLTFCLFILKYIR